MISRIPAKEPRQVLTKQKLPAKQGRQQRGTTPKETRVNLAESPFEYALLRQMATDVKEGRQQQPLPLLRPVAEAKQGGNRDRRTRWSSPRYPESDLVQI